MAEPIANAASNRAIKWSRDPRVREQQVKNPNYHPPKGGLHAAPAKRQPSLIEMSPAQIADRAKRIVNAEVAAERLPFQQRATQLAGEEQGALQTHAKDYGQLEAGTKNLAAQNAESAKTFQNTAAEMVKKAEQQAPGAAASAEHGAVGSEVAKQQEAARSLLTAIASGAQSGTNARQQSESNFLTNLQGTAAQENVAGGKQISGEYGKKKQEVSNQEAQINAGKQGRVGKLIQNAEGEQEKLKLAAGSLNIKGKEAERHGAETRSNIQNRKETQGVNRQKLANEGRKIEIDAGYKAANAGSKKQKDALDIKKKEVEIKNALEKHGHGLTAAQVAASSGEAAKAFNIFRRARENGAPPKVIREALERGYFHREPSNKKQAEQWKKEKRKPYNEKTGLDLKQPIWLDVAEQIMQKEYVDAPTKQRLREMGLPDSEWSNHFLGGSKGKKQPTGLHSPAHMGK